MTTTKEFLWQFFKVDHPSTFRDDYIDKTVDRERKPEKQSKWAKYNFLRAYYWYPSHYSAFERKFLMKFDAFVFFFLCASFYTKYLDNTNVGSAYVSGLQKDLNLKGNELNYFNTCYTVGYALFQIPITLLITKPQFARHLLLYCELAWGMMTLANAYVTSAKQMYVIRFFIGAFEACSFPATYVILSSYLTEEELFKRAGFYGAFATAGSASSGALQTQARKSLNGINGLAGWRWQFIIDAVITFGVFLIGFFTFPGTPSACKKFMFFTEDDMIFARKRLEGKIAFPKKFTWKTVKEVVTTWQVYLGSALWVLHHILWYSNGAKLYMKSKPEIYTVGEVTTWDAYMYVVGIPCAILISPLCKYYGKLIPVNIVMISAYYSAIILVIWNVKNSAIIGAFFMIHPFQDGLAQVYYSWIATLCRDNVEKKALVLSWVQALSYGINAFSIPLQYPVSEAPEFKKGYRVNLGLMCLGHVVFFAILFLDKYDKKYFPKIAGNRHYNEDGIFDKIESENEGGSNSDAYNHSDNDNLFDTKKNEFGVEELHVSENEVDNSSDDQETDGIHHRHIIEV
jgi:ACS family pantothenate transporter-like MFS transporter